MKTAQHNYLPEERFILPPGRLKYLIEVNDCPQMVHFHSSGEECNERCYGVILT